MGQKVHPGGFRIGVITGWRSNWFSERDFASYLDEDRKVRDYITRRLSHAGLSAINLRKDAQKLTVDIFTARPGIVIGKSGSEVEALRKELNRDHRQGDSGQHQRDQAPRARREAGRPVDRRAAREPGQLPSRDEARADLRHALRRPGRQGAVLGTPRRGRDVALGALLRRAACRCTRCARTSTTASTRPRRPSVASASRSGSTAARCCRRASPTPAAVWTSTHRPRAVRAVTVVPTGTVAVVVAGVRAADRVEVAKPC